MQFRVGKQSEGINKFLAYFEQNYKQNRQHFYSPPDSKGGELVPVCYFPRVPMNTDL